MLATVFGDRVMGRDSALLQCVGRGFSRYLLSSTAHTISTEEFRVGEAAQKKGQREREGGEIMELLATCCFTVSKEAEKLASSSRCVVKYCISCVYTKGERERVEERECGRERERERKMDCNARVVCAGTLDRTHQYSFVHCRVHYPVHMFSRAYTQAAAVGGGGSAEGAEEGPGYPAQ